MIDLVPSPSPLVAQEKTAQRQPSFFGALRGVWLLTWRSQLTWRRLPLGVLILLALPLLVYITTKSPQAWAQHQSWAANPPAPLDGFARRLTRTGTPLKPEQKAALLRIFSEEFAHANSDLSVTSDASVSQQSEQIKACYERLQSRAEGVLDDRQFAQFQTFQKRRLEDNLAKVSAPRWTRTGPFYHWLIDFYFFMILPLNCVRVCGALIQDELQADTLGFLTTRPLSRARLLVAKYISQTVLLEIILLIETLLIFAAGQLRQIPALGALLLLFLAAQFLAVLAWSALGAFLGQVTRRYMAMALVYGLIVEMGIGRIPTNINTLSLMRHLKVLLAHNPALQGTYEWAGQGVLLSVGALVLAAVMFLGLAALLFAVREYHHTEEMQK